MAIICIYNICGISGRENIQYYEYALDSILNQDFDDFKVIVSSCLSLQSTIDHLRKKYPQKIWINWIKDKVPVNVSFNHSVLEYVKRFGEAEGYTYIDSGCNWTNSKQILNEIYSILKNKNAGMVSIRTNTDTGFPAWLGIGQHDNDSQGFNQYFRNLKNHYKIPLGKTINLHCQLFSHKILEVYNNILPDIFAGQCSESVFSFLNSAIHKDWYIHKDLEIEHITGLDIPSVGFSPPEWVKTTGRPTFDQPFIIDSVLLRIRGGIKYGLGYEEVREIALHDKSKFDEDEYAVCPELKDYIKNNLFLQKHEFDYDKINYEWII